MISTPFERLRFKRQFRTGKKSTKEVRAIGFDTETKQGLCKLITSSGGGHCNPENFQDIIDFLCKRSRRGTTGFFFNLKYDFQAILKWLPETFWLDIFEKGKITFNITDNFYYEITYIPKKLLSIREVRSKWVKNKFGSKEKRKTRRFDFYDIAQYFKGYSLDKASKEYLGKGKLKHNFNLKDLQDADFKNPKLIEYCVVDAKRTKELSDLWISICNDNDLYPTNFCSPASISSQYFLERCRIPTINKFFKDSKYPFLKIVYDTVSGAFINVYKKGFFENIYSYDINSAYPYEMTQLPDITKGRFVYEKGKIPGGSVMGWLYVKVSIWTDHAPGVVYHPPFPILRKNLPNYFPIGEIFTAITLLEYETLKEYYDIDIMEGLYWLPLEPLIFPLSDLINEMYENRKKTKDKNTSYFLKIALNAIYGKNLQKYLERDDTKKDFGYMVTGNMFNPFWASYILAGTRLALFNRLCQLDPHDIIACFTDSVITTKPMPYDKKKTLGTWGLDQTGSALIIGCGVYTIKGKKTKSKIRGFNVTEKVDLFEVVKKRYKEKTLKINIIQNVTPLQSLFQKDKFNPQDMNKLLDTEREININFDSKRLWDAQFKNAGEMLENNIDSFPLINGM